MTDEELVAALAEHRLTTPRQCLCGWRQEGEWSDTAHAEHLLPVVRRVAEQRAAEELRAAADELSNWRDNADRYSETVFDSIDMGRALGRVRAYERAIANLRARAAALTATPNHGTDAT